MPAALWAKDYHSLWLNTAALRRAGGDLEVPAASSSATSEASRPGSCAKSRRGASASGSSHVSEDEWVDATRDGHPLANQRGVTSIHDKDGWLGAHRRLRPASTRRAA